MWIVQLTDATEAQLDKVGEIWYSRLSPEPWFQAISGFESSNLRKLFRDRAAIGSNDGDLYVAGTGTQPEGSIEAEDIKSAIHIISAGVDFGQSKKTPGGLFTFRHLLSPEMQKWHDEVIFAQFNTWKKTAFEDKGVSLKDNIYISALATESGWDGQGLASALVKHVLAMADEQQVGVTLLSLRDDLVRRYEKLGFVVTGQTEYDIRGQDVILYGMVRYSTSNSGRDSTS